MALIYLPQLPGADAERAVTSGKIVSVGYELAAITLNAANRSTASTRFWHEAQMSVDRCPRGKPQLYLLSGTLQWPPARFHYTEVVLRSARRSTLTRASQHGRSRTSPPVMSRCQQHQSDEPNIAPVR